MKKHDPNWTYYYEMLTYYLYYNYDFLALEIYSP